MSQTNHPTTLSPLVQLKLHARLNHWSYHKWSEVFFVLFFLFIYTLGQQVNCHDYDKANILTIITKTLLTVIFSYYQGVNSGLVLYKLDNMRKSRKLPPSDHLTHSQISRYQATFHPKVCLLFAHF